MMMHSSSFESLKPYLFGYYLKNSITALLRYVILAQSTPISLHTEDLVPFVSLSTVSYQNSYVPTLAQGLVSVATAAFV